MTPLRGRSCNPKASNESNHCSFQTRQAGGLAFPIRRQLCNPVLNLQKFAVNGRCSSRLFVSLGSFEFEYEFALPLLQFLNFFLELADNIFLRPPFARERLALFSLDSLLIFS